MPIPVWVLLGFAAWTLFILFVTVGVYRWSRILIGRTAIAEWRADERQGSEWYRRAVRAHLNCLENSPDLYRNCRCLTNLTRQQSNPRRISDHDTRGEDLSKLDPLAGGTNKCGRGHTLRVLLRASDLHDRDGHSYCHLRTKLVRLGSLADVRPVSARPLSASSRLFDFALRTFLYAKIVCPIVRGVREGRLYLITEPCYVRSASDWLAYGVPGASGSPGSAPGAGS